MQVVENNIVFLKTKRNKLVKFRATVSDSILVVRFVVKNAFLVC